MPSNLSKFVVIHATHGSCMSHVKGQTPQDSSIVIEPSHQLHRAVKCLAWVHPMLQVNAYAYFVQSISLAKPISCCTVNFTCCASHKQYLAVLIINST